MTKAKEIIGELVETLSTTVIVVLVIYWLVAFPEVVFGASMEPTFYTGERILVERITKHFDKYDRGDVVILIPPEDERHYIKRIVGIEGDIVKVLDCNVYISRDGEKFVLEEPYLYDDMCTNPGPALTEGRGLRLNEGEYLVFGDNRKVSQDSRLFGVVTEDRIIGKVVLRFWPLNKVSIF